MVEFLSKFQSRVIKIARVNSNVPCLAMTSSRVLVFWWGHLLSFHHGYTHTQLHTAALTHIWARLHPHTSGHRCTHTHLDTAALTLIWTRLHPHTFEHGCTFTHLVTAAPTYTHLNTAATTDIRTRLHLHTSGHDCTQSHLDTAAPTLTMINTVEIIICRIRDIKKFVFVSLRHIRLTESLRLSRRAYIAKIII